MISNLVKDRVAINIRCKLRHRQTMCRSGSDYLTSFFTRRQVNVKSLMKTLRLQINGIELSQYVFNHHKYCKYVELMLLLLNSAYSLIA